MEIITKTLDDGTLIYAVKYEKGIKLRYPVGYSKSEKEAIEAYENALMNPPIKDNANNQTEKIS